MEVELIWLDHSTGPKTTYMTSKNIVWLKKFKTTSFFEKKLKQQHIGSTQVNLLNP